MREGHGVSKICDSLGISRSGYYSYKDSSHQNGYWQEVEQAVISIFWFHKRRYGARRIILDLADMGMRVGRERVRSIMERNGLRAIQPKSFVPKTTQSDPRHIRTPNLLLDRDLPDGPNQVWVGDITYLPTEKSEWLYLSTWLDLWCHRIVGWHIEEHMEAGLVLKSFENALGGRKVGKGLIVHSDGGGQYASNEFRARLGLLECRQSMTRRDNHYDNATAESFFSRFKAELLDGGEFIDLEDARTEVFDYIDCYYNTIRRHSSLGGKSPLQFERESGY